jgi:hypothetical protein
MLKKSGNCCFVAAYSIWTVLPYVGVSCMLLLSSCNFYNFNNFVPLASTRLRFPEDNADALKHVGVLTIYRILLIYICICSALVGRDNKQAKYYILYSNKI